MIRGAGAAVRKMSQSRARGVNIKKFFINYLSSDLGSDRVFFVVLFSSLSSFSHGRAMPARAMAPL